MKNTENRKEERGSRIKKALLLSGLMALLWTPYLVNTSYAQGNISGNYQGMAYLAEQEIRTQELQANTEGDEELVACTLVNDNESDQDDK